LLLTLSLFGYSQTATLTGTITDKETGELLIGATVIFQGTTTGAVADLDGNYTVMNIQPGTYSVICQFISYQPDTVKNVTFAAGETKTMNFAIGTQSVLMDEVVIAARANKAGTFYMMSAKQESAVLLDGISAKEISRGGDSDVASALKRVTGVTVEGGKYVYVRGLSDRYSKTTLNGAVMPSLDPRRNAVQMDMFPVSMVDNISIFKTFSPDLPGDFTGGLVNIATKDYPDELQLEFSVGLGYNTNATFNDNFRTSNTTGDDWLARGSKERDVSEIVRDNDVNPIDFSSFADAQADAGLTDQEWSELSFNERQEFLAVSREQRNLLLTNQTKSFNKAWTPEKHNAGLNQSYNLAFGNKVLLFGNDFGFNIGLNYGSENEFYDDGRTGRYSLTGNVDDIESLNTERDLSDMRGDQSRKWGALVNLSYFLNKNNLIGFNYLHNQNGLNSGRYQEGLNQSDANDLYIRVNSGRYIERRMDAFQLKGEHTLPGLNKTIINWQISRVNSRMITPDLRVFTNDYTVRDAVFFFDNQGNNITDEVAGWDPEDIADEFPGFTTDTLINGDTLFNVSPNLYPYPTRYYRDMFEYNNHAQVHIKIPFNAEIKGKESSVKIGGSVVDKDREMDELRFAFQNQGASLYTGDDAAYFADSNMSVFPQQDFLYLRDDTELRNSYRATERDYAAYAMVDWKITQKLRVITGLRLETTNIQTRSLDTAQAEGNLDRSDLLPAFNGVYQLTDKMNVRLSYARTLARPTFRELAPFANYDFEDQFVYVGNTELERTLVDNFDLRWEMFPNPGEIISVSGFFKKFENPIEKVVNPEAQNVEITWENVADAEVIGVEFEFRKNLKFFGRAFKDFNFGTNLAWISSKTTIDPDELEQIRAQDPGHPDTRVMFGQAPYVVNAYLNYLNREKGWEANLTYNVIGPRMSLVVKGGTPNVFEEPFPLLNFNVGKTLGEHFTVKLSASNILNSLRWETYTFKGEKYKFQANTIGTTFGISVKYTL
jgi:outer membrane receptor protein involved in Fe transport